MYTAEVSCVYSYEVVICVYILVRCFVCSLVRYSDHALVRSGMCILLRLVVCILMRYSYVCIYL